MSTPAFTRRETVRLLCKSILNRLENQKSIIFAPRLRTIVQDEIFGIIGPSIFTEEDLKVKTLERMGAKTDELKETSFTESDQFRAAKAIVKSGFGDDELNGFYFQKPVKQIAHMISEYLMRSSHIDDVYETDEDLERKVVDVIQRFNPAELH